MAVIGHIQDNVTWCTECATAKAESWRFKHAIHQGELSEADGIRCDQCGMPLLGKAELPKEFAHVWRQRVARRQRQAIAERVG